MDSRESRKTGKEVTENLVGQCSLTCCLFNEFKVKVVVTIFCHLSYTIPALKEK